MTTTLVDRELELTPRPLTRRELAALNEAEAFEFGPELSERPEAIALRIDGEGALECDDSFSIIRFADGRHILRVNISDIAAFLDQLPRVEAESRRRGFSKYQDDNGQTQDELMIPSPLSQGKFSILEGQETPVMTYELHLSADGVLQEVDVRQERITELAAYTYSEVSRMLNDKTDRLPAQKRYLGACLDLARQLHANRVASGDTSTAFSEAMADTDDVFQGQEGERMVQEFMIIAGRAITDLMVRNSVPGLHREVGTSKRGFMMPGRFVPLPTAEEAGEAGIIFPDATSPLRKRAALINLANLSAFLGQRHLPVEQRQYPYQGEALAIEARRLTSQQEALRGRQRRKLARFAIEQAAAQAELVPVA